MQTAERKFFNIDQTNIAKGIACVLLLCHHLFYSVNSYEHFTSLWLYRGVPLESKIALMCRVCVTIFTFLSGFGINEVINRRLAKGDAPVKTLLRTSISSLWKLWAGYIVVFLIFVPWQGLFDRHPYTSVLDLVWDILGISFIAGTPTMNETWWFMSVAIASYTIAPLFKIVLVKRKTLLLAVFPLFYLLWLLYAGIFWCYAFLFGMIASELGLFDLLHERFVRFKSIYTWGVCSVLVLTTGLMRYISPSWGDFPFAVAILIFSFLCVSRLHFVSTILKFIGKHSANIFFFHSFLYLYNFQPFVYAPKYAPLILTIFIIECLAVSVVIEFIKKISGIQKGIGLVRKVLERQF
jgi:hypothetical protein